MAACVQQGGGEASVRIAGLLPVRAVALWHAGWTSLSNVTSSIISALTHTCLTLRAGVVAPGGATAARPVDTDCARPRQTAQSCGEAQLQTKQFIQAA